MGASDHMRGREFKMEMDSSRAALIIGNGMQSDGEYTHAVDIFALVSGIHNPANMWHVRKFM